MTSHSGWRIALIIITTVLYAVELAIAALASNSLGRELGLFLNGTGAVSDKFALNITPASWTFSIWGFIFTWQLIWIIYALTTICRTNSENIYIYRLSLLPPAFYIVYNLNTIFVVAWLFLWDRQWMDWATLDIVFTPITLFICLGISFWQLYKNLQTMRLTGLTKDIWMIRLFVQNGLAFFATWVSIATLLNFAIALTYVWGVEMQTACTIALSILSAEIVIWFTLDMFVWDKYIRYTISPFIVLFLGLSGSLSKNFDLDNNYTSSVFVVVLLGVTAILAIIKVIMLIYRHRKYPIKGNTGDDFHGTLA